VTDQDDGRVALREPPVANDFLDAPADQACQPGMSADGRLDA
jgi:hypothetical protein